MPREISAGGVVVREVAGVWHVALIEAQRSEAPTRSDDLASSGRAQAGRGSRKKVAVLSLPKGLVDAGEKAEAAAIREVREETGIVAEAVTKLADNKYVYVRTWGDGERVFKIVTFYLMRYVTGEIDDLDSAMRIEVKRALWVPLAEAAKRLVYSNERKVLRQAQEYVAAYGVESRRAARSLQ